MPTNPNSASNGQGERIDTLWDEAGEPFIKLAGDPIDVAGAAQQGAPERVQMAKAGSATRTAVAAAALDTLLLNANSLRKGFAIKNDADKTLYLGYGPTAASSTDYTVDLVAGAYFEDPFHFSGEIRGRWATGPTGNARITELS